MYQDLSRMKDFYTRVLGLQVTDEDEAEGMVFLSSRPEAEHHELVLAGGRLGGPEVRATHWRNEPTGRRVAACASPSARP